MSPRRRRSGFALFELLVFLAILLVLLGLLMAAVARVRMAATQTQCANNLKQIVLAIHNCNDTYNRMPPGVGTFPPNAGNPAPNFGNTFFFLTAFLEHAAVYKNSAGEAVAPGGALAGKANDGAAPWPKAGGSSYGGVNWAGFNETFGTPIKTFQCPQDPSLPPGGRGRGQNPGRVHRLVERRCQGRHRLFHDVGSLQLRLQRPGLPGR